MSVADKIRNRRKFLGISQGELARRVGYADRTAISKIERGEFDIKRDKLMVFAKALECSPSDFFDYADTEEDAEKTGVLLGQLMLDEELLHAVEKLVNLPSEKQKSIINMINVL